MELRVELLGSPNAFLGDEPLTGFVSVKARALLYYLAATGQRHMRPALAGLLWSDVPQATAMRNLRDVLSNLRRLAPDHLAITRQHAAIRPEAPLFVDSVSFSQQLTKLSWGGASREALSAAALEELGAAVALYKDDFLAGFSLSDAPVFDEWVLGQRQRLRAELEAGLADLVDAHSVRGELGPAIAYAQRLLRLDPLREATHRQLMQLFAWEGDRARALRQYEACAQILDEALGVGPDAETVALYHDLQAGAAARPKDGYEIRHIRGYEQRERIGSGSYCTVFRAYQPLVERDVAIKVIHARYASRPQFIRRFQADAKLIAQLEHPYIVPLYDYWRDPAGAYLVMRWLEGGNLHARLAETSAPLAHAQALTLFNQIATALDWAHRQGAVHGAIKPSNVLLDHDGNAYLSDFRIALDPGGDDPVAQAMPALSPTVAPQWERLLRQPASTENDIYCLNLILYEMLVAGREPGLAAAERPRWRQSASLAAMVTADPDLPPPIARVLARAFARDPQARFATAGAVAAALWQALGESAPATPVAATRPPAEVVNPYKGLRPFHEPDANLFFGREALTQRLVARLGDALAKDAAAAPRFLALVGPSGSGKSSVVHAGLIPALRRGALPGADSWFMTEMTPGPSPMRQLERALLGIAAEPVDDLGQRLRASPSGALDAVHALLPDADTLLLLIDQFEDVFDLAEDARELAFFLEALTYAVSTPGSRLVVIITLRADYIDRPLQQLYFGELLSQCSELVPPLTPEGLERAIVEPARMATVGVEPGLTSTITAEVINQPGTLPLLQYALTELFAERDGRLLTLAAYRQIGGVTGALARRAEELYGQLAADDQALVRQIFMRLATTGETVDGERRPLRRRRRVLRSELLSLQGENRRSNDILERYGHYRLLTFDRDPDTREPTVEVAHEALFVEWPRLARWLAGHRSDLSARSSLAAAATEWRQAEEEKSFLLVGGRLAQFSAWASETDLVLAQTERAFLDASVSAQRERERVESDRRARAVALQQRSRKWLRGLVFVFATTTVLAVVLGFLALERSWVAEEQRLVAEEQASLALSRELAAAALNNLRIDPERSVLLALYALDQAHTFEAENALHQALASLYLIETLAAAPEAIWDLAISADERYLALADFGGNAQVVDLASGELICALPGGAVAFHPDGALLAAAGPDDHIRVWDFANCRVTLDVAAAPASLPSVALSPDGSLVAATLDDATVGIWDANTGRLLHTLVGHEPVPAVAIPFAGVFQVAFSPDGMRVATAGSDGTVRLWDVERGEPLLVLRGHDNQVMGVAFSPDGNLLATTGYDGTVRVWTAVAGAQAGRQLFSIDHGQALSRVAFDATGDRLAAVGWDGIPRIWSAATGRPELTLYGQSGLLRAVAFSRDGNRLVTAGDDKTVSQWTLTPGEELLTLVGHGGAAVEGVAFSSDGTRLATAGHDWCAHLWDFPAGTNQMTLVGHEGGLNGILFGPNDTFLASASFDRTVRTWEAGSGAPLLALPGGDRGVAISPDGALLATSPENGMVTVYDARSGDLLWSRHDHDQPVWNVAFSPDGSLVAAGSWDGLARVWAAASGEEVFSWAADNEVFDVAFSPDGSVLAVSSRDGAVTLLSLAEVRAAGRPLLLTTLTGHATAVLSVAFSPDGRYLATSSFDGVVKVWDAGDLRGADAIPPVLDLAAHADAVVDLAFSPDGRYLATASLDGTTKVLVLDLDELVALAWSKVTRGLTDAECQQFLHVDVCPPPRPHEIAP